MTKLIEEARRTKGPGQQVIDGLEDAVNNIAGAKSFDELIADKETKKRKLEKKIQFANSMRDVIKMFEDQAHEQHCCPLCENSLAHGSDAMRKFSDNLKEFSTDTDDPAKVKEKLDNVDCQISALRDC